MNTFDYCDCKGLSDDEPDADRRFEPPESEIHWTLRRSTLLIVVPLSVALIAVGAAAVMGVFA